MNYWTMLKYALMLLFALILGIGVYVALDNIPDDQPNVPQANQSKFNI